ncbi:hypothetical protein ED208_11990 [Stagnimonas aquatica]|uniref:CopL family metal-binding regulatory protein n=1 Tax=Stagnimonas aquatica TaxID=2689987 RepID=A0A3N0V8N5_9GAMM|nr:hypothetical protein [Stagnimonas aquatica]ROH89123.1 hypothetical protein ED208_11990 [Stagnimonas aquatica]
MFLRRLLLLCLLTSHLLALPGIARAAAPECRHAQSATTATAATESMDHASMGHGDHHPAAATGSQTDAPSTGQPGCHCGCPCAANHCMPGGGMALPLAFSPWLPQPPRDRLAAIQGSSEPLPAHQGRQLRPPDPKTA